MEISEYELRQMYHADGMTQREIADKFGVSHNTISICMIKHGIEPRTPSEAQLIGIRIPSKEELHDMYRAKGMSMSEIGEKIGVSSMAVCSWMGKHRIKARTNPESLIGKFTGENAGNWNGGTSFEPYCERFNNDFKESVRKRDDYTCQLCGCEQLLGGQKLDVHHIHYDKENCYPDVVALCRSCNANVNGDRNYWEQYFESQLSERGMLNWSLSRET